MYKTVLSLSLFSVILLAGCSSDSVNLGFKKQLAQVEGDKEAERMARQSQSVAEHIAPVGKLTMASEIQHADVTPEVSTPSEALKLSIGPEHTVKMLNMGDGGSMIFEPAVLKVSLGDTVHFKAVDMSHNSAAVDGMIPEDASTWAGQLNQDISVTFDTEGVYVYQCDPHVVMAMVGVIQVGDPVNLENVQAKAKEYKSMFVMNGDRLDEYLRQL